ncbi:MAG: hypothetical protein HKN47_14510 [Pirellulaceae bacterium]|nr:hypothetical protein [Pirellulaceae bacterium]
MLIRTLMKHLLGVAILVAATSDADAGCDDACDAYAPSSCFANQGCCQPNWTFAADALFLRRSDPDSEVLAFNTVDPSESLNADDFQFGTETGLDLSITRHLKGGKSLELRYFGVDQWDAAVVGQTTRNDLLQINAAVAVFADAGDAIAARYTSELKNGELNLSFCHSDSIDLLVGFRYLELSERANASLINASVPFDYYSVTDNRLYGAQIGAKACLWNDRLVSLNLVGKAGIYGNDASHDSLITSGTATLTANGDGSPTSFIGEIGLRGGLCLTDTITLRGGYNLLWLDGVAVASDQLSSSDYFAGTGFDGSGDLFYHGASVGLELRR